MVQEVALFATVTAQASAGRARGLIDDPVVLAYRPFLDLGPKITFSCSLDLFNLERSSDIRRLGDCFP